MIPSWAGIWKDSEEECLNRFWSSGKTTMLQGLPLYATPQIQACLSKKQTLEMYWHCMGSEYFNNYNSYTLKKYLWRGPQCPCPAELCRTPHLSHQASLLAQALQKSPRISRFLLRLEYYVVEQYSALCAGALLLYFAWSRQPNLLWAASLICWTSCYNG